MQKITGIYSRYQYESLQKRLDIDKLIMVNLPLKCEQVFPCRIWQALMQTSALNTLFA